MDGTERLAKRTEQTEDRQHAGENGDDSNVLASIALEDIELSLETDDSVAPVEERGTNASRPPELGHDGMNMADRKAAMDQALKWLRQEMKMLRNESGKLKTQFAELSLQVHSMKLDAQHYSDMTKYRHSSISLNESELMDDSNEFTLNGVLNSESGRPRSHSATHAQGPVNRSMSYPYRRTSSSRFFSYQLRDGLPSATEDSEPFESTPLNRAAKSKVSDVLNEAEEDSAEEYPFDDMPSPIKHALDLTDEQNNQANHFPPGSGSDKSPSKGSSGQHQSNEISLTLPTSEAASSAMAPTKSTIANRKHSQSSEQPPKTVFDQKSISSDQDTVSSGSDPCSSRGSSPARVGTSSQEPSTESSPAQAEQQCGPKKDTLCPQQQVSTRSSIRRRQPLRANTRKKFIEHQRQQVIAAAESLGFGNEAQGLQRQYNSGDAESFKVTASDSQSKENPRQRVLSSSSVESLSKADLAGSMPSVQDIGERSVSPSGIIHQRSDSIDFSLVSPSGGWRRDQNSGSLPSVQDIDFTSPSGRIHLQKDSADFSFASEFMSLEERLSAPSSPSGSTTNLTRPSGNRRQPLGVTHSLSMDADVGKVPPRSQYVTVQRSLSTNSKTLRNAATCELRNADTSRVPKRPFWLPNSELLSGNSNPSWAAFCPVDPMRSSSKRPTAIALESKVLHKRSGSIPENLFLAGAPKRRSAPPATATPSAVGGSMAINLQQRHGHVRHHSADFNFQDTMPLTPTAEEPGQVGDTGSQGKYRSNTLPRKFRIQPSYRAAISSDNEEDRAIPEANAHDHERRDDYRANSLPRKFHVQPSYRAAISQPGDGDDAFSTTESNADDQMTGDDYQYNTLPRLSHMKASFRAAMAQSEESGRMKPGAPKRHSSPLLYSTPSTESTQQKTSSQVEYSSPSVSLPPRPVTSPLTSPAMPRSPPGDLRAVAIYRAQQAALAVDHQAKSQTQPAGAARQVSSPAGSGVPKMKPGGVRRRISLDILHQRKRLHGDQDGDHDEKRDSEFKVSVV